MPIIEEKATRHLSEDDLILFAVDRLAPSEMELIESHLCSCSQCQDCLIQAVKLKRRYLNAVARRSSKERRLEPRLPADGPGVMRVLIPFVPNRLEIRLLDRSLHGAKLQVPIVLPPGAVVQIRLRDAILLAEIRYCVPAEEGHHVGIYIENVQSLGRDEQRGTAALFPDTGQHLHHEDLRLYISGQLFGERLSYISGHLERCTKCREAMVSMVVGQGPAEPMPAGTRIGRGGPERRAEPRISVSDSAEMRVLAPFSARLWEVSVLDVSRNGAKMRVPIPVLPGSTVQVRVKSLLIVAQVRYCAEFSGAYHVGVWIQDVFPS
jgi:hypothetical protein